MNDTTSTSDKRSSVGINRATLTEPAPHFELMPEEKLIYQGFVVHRFRARYGPTEKVRDGYLTSHRMVVCRKFFGQPEPIEGGTGAMLSYIVFYMIMLPFMNRKSKKIVFEFPLVDVLKFEMLNEPSRHLYMFELRDGRKYVLDFRFLAGGVKLPWGPEDRWVTAIQTALQNVQKD